MPFTPVLPRKAQIAVQSSVSLRHLVRIREQNCQVTLLADNRLSSTTAKIRPSDCACHLSGIRLGFYRVHPARARPLVAPRNFAPAGEEGSGLLRLPSLGCSVLRCPTAWAHAGAFRLERSCSLGVEVKRAVPLPSERNAKHEHNRNPHLHRMPRNRSTTREQPRQAFQIPGSTTGMENCFTSGMSHTRCHATVRNTGSGSGLLGNAHPHSSLLRLRT